MRPCIFDSRRSAGVCRLRRTFQTLACWSHVIFLIIWDVRHTTSPCRTVSVTMGLPGSRSQPESLPPPLLVSGACTVQRGCHCVQIAQRHLTVHRRYIVHRRRVIRGGHRQKFCHGMHFNYSTNAGLPFMITMNVYCLVIDPRPTRPPWTPHMNRYGWIDGSFVA